MSLRIRRIVQCLAALTVPALVVGVGIYVNLPKYGLADRVANEEINLPLAAPTPHPWTAVNAFPQLTLVEPVYVTHAPGEPTRLYVVERLGKIKAFDKRADVEAATTFLDLTDRVMQTEDGDDGALGLAFHPEFAKDTSAHRGELFVFYSCRENGRRTNRLSRFRLTDGATAVDAASEEVLIDQEDEDKWHDGACVQFGPDGFLYVSLGDEGYTNDYYENGQRIDKDLFSGILRIDVDRRGGAISHAPPRQPVTGRTSGYYIPNDNPFVGVAGALEEFWSIGFRNPYRMSFDRDTGELWVGDVGNELREEINIAFRGSNHGWSYAEGSVPFSGSYLNGQRPRPYPGIDAPPVHEYSRSNGDTCVIGGYVYRGKKYPQLQGKYLFGDNSSSRVWALEYEGGVVKRRTELVDMPEGSQIGISSFGEDADGEIYICVLGTREGRDGEIRTLVPTDSSVSPSLPRKLSETGLFADTARLTPKPGVVPYDVNLSFWSDGAEKQRWIMVPGSGNDPNPSHDRIDTSDANQWRFPVGTVFVKNLEIALDESLPEDRRRLETRVLVAHSEGGYYGVTYRWNEEQTEAFLLHDRESEDLTIRLAGGGTRVQRWDYPSPQDCTTCHTEPAGYVLGFNRRQLNRSVKYSSSGRSDNQLRALGYAGFFTHSWSDEQIAEFDRVVSSSETTASLDLRVKSYLEVNCANCHRPGGVRATFDARFDVPLESRQLIYGALTKHLGHPDAKVVSPGQIARSMAVLRMMDGRYPMPPLGRNVRDFEGIALLSEWIDQLPIDPAFEPVEPAPPEFDHGTAAPIVDSGVNSNQGAEATGF